MDLRERHELGNDGTGACRAMRRRRVRPPLESPATVEVNGLAAMMSPAMSTSDWDYRGLVAETYDLWFEEDRSTTRRASCGSARRQARSERPYFRASIVAAPYASI
jgi:hypothetical protein